MFNIVNVTHKDVPQNIQGRFSYKRDTLRANIASPDHKEQIKSYTLDFFNNQLNSETEIVTGVA